MNIENLVTMANQIGSFFDSYPDKAEASTEISGHLRRYWAPRMRVQLLGHVDALHGEGLSPIVLTSIQENRAKLL
jgi:formate dehydrogenase subunit delta